jgi:hypothetical protein
VSALLLSAGCLRVVKWREPAVYHPIIPVEEYPDYEIPEDLQTKEDKAKIVDALMKAEKYGLKLKARVDKYNNFAKGKNLKARELFK